MELTFFTGYHGAGKTYAALQLIEDGFDAVIVDCGPIIRGAFVESGIDHFNEWVRQQETELGERWDNILLIRAIQNNIAALSRRPKRLFIVGNRSLQTIEFLRERLSEGGADKIIFFERPFSLIKSGYEARTGVALTHEEFSVILRRDEDMGLLHIRAHIESNPQVGAIIVSDRYDLDSIRAAGRLILGMQITKTRITIAKE